MITKTKTLSKILVLTIFGLLLSGFNSCKKDGIARNTPICIVEKINEFKDFSCDDGKVDEFIFQEKIVYVFDPGIKCGADLTSEVVDEECKTLGYLGGLSGNNIINGESFVSAQFERNIWKK
jgi:hypothetical protein